MTDRWYKLMGKVAVPCGGLEEWARWIWTAEQHVARDEIGPCIVSTVFLGLDHRHGDGDPLLFETMIFNDNEDSYKVRTTTWDQAEAAHAEAVALAKARLAQADDDLPEIFRKPLTSNGLFGPKTAKPLVIKKTDG